MLIWLSVAFWRRDVCLVSWRQETGLFMICWCCREVCFILATSLEASGYSTHLPIIRSIFTPVGEPVNIWALYSNQQPVRLMRGKETSCEQRKSCLSFGQCSTAVDTDGLSFMGYWEQWIKLSHGSKFYRTNSYAMVRSKQPWLFLVYNQLNYIYSVK